MVSRKIDVFIRDLPAVAFPAWELIDRIALEARAARPEVPIGFSAKAQSTTFSADDLDSLREEVAEAPWPVDEIGFIGIDDNSIDEFSVTVNRGGSAWGRVISTDRVFVDHFHALVSEWFASFATRDPIASAASPSSQMANDSKPPTPIWRRWDIITAAGTVALVILTLVGFFVVGR